MLYVMYCFVIFPDTMAVTMVLYGSTHYLEELHQQIGGVSSVVAKTPWKSTWANGYPMLRSSEGNCQPRLPQKSTVNIHLDILVPSI